MNLKYKIVSILIALLLICELAFSQDRMLQNRGAMVSGNLRYTLPLAGAQLSGQFADNPIQIISIDAFVMANYFIIPKYLIAGVGSGITTFFPLNRSLVPIIFELKGIVVQERDAVYATLQYAHAEPLGSLLTSGGFINLGLGYQFIKFNQVFHFEGALNLRYFADDYERYRYSSNAKGLLGVSFTLGYRLPIKKLE